MAADGGGGGSGGAGSDSGTGRAVQSLPPPLPKSPPDLYGRRREIARLKMLEREKGFLEEELKFVEGLQPASRCCKEIVEFVTANGDPLIPTNRKMSKPCRLWKWLCGSSCFNFSWICCCTGCSLRLKAPTCNCCCEAPDCSSCITCSLPKCSCWCNPCPHCCTTNPCPYPWRCPCACSCSCTCPGSCCSFKLPKCLPCSNCCSCKPSCPKCFVSCPKCAFPKCFCPCPNISCPKCSCPKCSCPKCSCPKCSCPKCWDVSGCFSCIKNCCCCPSSCCICC